MFNFLSLLYNPLLFACWALIHCYEAPRLINKYYSKAFSFFAPNNWIMANYKRILWDYKKYIITILAPLLIMPLPIVVQNSKADCAFVLILMAVYWCTECIPLAVTALFPIFFFPMMGIMTSEQVCLEYFSDTTILGAGGLMVAVGVEYWNLHKRLALGVLMLVGIKPALLMMGFMAITAFLSMWVSSMASTAIMLPIVGAVMENIGTAEANAEEHELQQNRANEVSQISQTTDNDSITQEPSPSEHVSAEQRRIKHEQKYVKLTKGMCMSVCYAAGIGGTGTLTGNFPSLILKAQFDSIYPKNGDIINYASWFGFAFPSMVIMLILSWVWLEFMYIGFNVKKAFGCGANKNIAREVYKETKREYRSLGRVSFAEWCVLVLFVLLVALWFTRDPGFMRGWASIIFNKEKKFVTDATVSIGISMIFFILPATIPRISCRCSSLNENDRSKIKAPETLLNWELVQMHMPWNILLLLGGALALSKGCAISGLSFWLGEKLQPLGNLPLAGLVFVLCLVVTLFTEVCNNAVISTIFIPVIASMASTFTIHPLYILLPITVSASYAFMLPVATPSNAIAFTFANLKILDMVKPGIVMNVLGLLCVSFAIHTWGVAMFSLNKYPEWANITTLQSP